MKILIVGVGKLGEYLAKALVRDHNEVTLIDKNFSTVQDVINNEDLNFVLGDGMNPNVLIESGISDCDLLISVMKADEHNIISSLLGKKLGAKQTIARIRTPEFIDSARHLQKDLGLSMIINPEQLTSDLIFRSLSIPSALNVTSFLKGKISLISIKIKENSNFVNSSINIINRNFKGKIIICAIDRDGETIIPSGSTKLHAGDRIYLTGTVKDINSFLKYDDLITGKIRNVLICGGSSISTYLARLLIDSNIHVKIIDINQDKCEKLSEIIPDAVIVNGDASNQNVLYEEGIEEVDAFISLTNIDEENIIYSMFASNLHVPKIITKVNHIELDGIVSKANIDTVVTPHKIATDHIVKYVRAISNSEKSECSAIYTLENNNFEMLEFNVSDDFKSIGVKLRDMNIKEDVIVISILRNNKIIFPGGNDTIEKGDIIVCIDSDNRVKNINDILA